MPRSTSTTPHGVLGHTQAVAPQAVIGTETIAASVAAWEDASSANIFGSQSAGTVNGVDESSTDGLNEVLFGPIAQNGTIAATIVWGVFYGPPQSRGLVEWALDLRASLS